MVARFLKFQKARLVRIVTTLKRLTYTQQQQNTENQIAR